MKCSICDNEKFFTVHTYDEPDKYEKWVGIEDVTRNWVCCMKCGFYIQIRNYELSQLESIYENGYRDEKFRGESIQHAFDRISTIKESENESRYLWFAMNLIYSQNRRVLDVGSGIGVWPYLLQRANYEVSCVEENRVSVDFIYENMGIKCFEGIDSVNGEYDAVTLIHILEHIEDTKSFLAKIKTLLKKGGHLFVEVPDAIEFSYLDKNHDEFNSCHVAFYNMSSLFKTLEWGGFTVVDMHHEHTKARNLSRTMCIAVNQS